MYRYFKIIAGVGNGRYIYYWQSKGFPDERINSITVCNYSVLRSSIIMVLKQE